MAATERRRRSAASTAVGKRPAEARPAYHWPAENGIYRADGTMDVDRALIYGVTGRSLGDMKEPAQRSEALAIANLAGKSVRLLKQVHGTQVQEAASGNVLAPIPEADGWITNDPDVVLGIFVADCLPIFIWDRAGSAVGVFHAGWRGLAAGMAGVAARAFQRYAIAPDHLCAAIGPHAGACCYEVGPEVAERFHPEALVAARGTSRDARDRGRRLLDLGEEARLQLIEEGVLPVAISVSNDCTVCHPSEFFSYRRDKMDRRMMGFIAAAGRV